MKMFSSFFLFFFFLPARLDIITLLNDSSFVTSQPLPLRLSFHTFCCPFVVACAPKAASSTLENILSLVGERVHKGSDKIKRANVLPLAMWFLLLNFYIYLSRALFSKLLCYTFYLLADTRARYFGPFYPSFPSNNEILFIYFNKTPFIVIIFLYNLSRYNYGGL